MADETDAVIDRWERGPLTSVPIFHGSAAQRARDMGVPVFIDGDTNELIVTSNGVTVAVPTEQIGAVLRPPSQPRR